MIELAEIVATATTKPGKSGPSNLWSFMPLIFVVVIFYFVMMRPRQRDQKKRKDMLAQMKKNDRVMTIGGVIGTVVLIKDDEVTLTEVFQDFWDGGKAHVSPSTTCAARQRSPD